MLSFNHGGGHPVRRCTPIVCLLCSPGRLADREGLHERLLPETSPTCNAVPSQWDGAVEQDWVEIYTKGGGGLIGVPIGFALSSLPSCALPLCESLGLATWRPFSCLCPITLRAFGLLVLDGVLSGSRSIGRGYFIECLGSWEGSPAAHYNARQHV
ncbi:unnamed protein product [Durusdinium trenchii]|uniref:Uncharacterized protein n=1 Tax=Durusdinium trenchii TaxID=1381693 RepID=A0ABP0K4B4_9DINO